LPRAGHNRNSAAGLLITLAAPSARESFGLGHRNPSTARADYSPLLSFAEDAPYALAGGATLACNFFVGHLQRDAQTLCRNLAVLIGGIGEKWSQFGLRIRGPVPAGPSGPAVSLPFFLPRRRRRIRALTPSNFAVRRRLPLVCCNTLLIPNLLHLGAHREGHGKGCFGRQGLTSFARVPDTVQPQTSSRPTCHGRWQMCSPVPAAVSAAMRCRTICQQS
jgi:hypothetical protein